MNYTKQAVDITQQIALLKSRGLQITDEAQAAAHLSNISYYRLRAYTYPFQDNDDTNHPFNVAVSIEQIIELYEFDCRLRSLVLANLERIEIGLRTQIIYQWAINHGSHWQLNDALFRDYGRFNQHLASLQAEINRSNETFIDHYKSTYTNPTEPPAWMSLEVSSFGLLSLMFLNLRNGAEKTAVTLHFGLNNVRLLENWIHCFSNIRNICAHHGRLWNRRLTAHISLPTNPRFEFLQNTNIYPYKLYAALSCMQYILKIINPANDFGNQLKTLMQTCPLRQEREMGFPAQWQTENLWN